MRKKVLLTEQVCLDAHRTKPGDTFEAIWDSKIDNFGLRLNTSAAAGEYHGKSFVFYYWHQRKKKSLTIAKFNSKTDMSDIRTTAGNLRGWVLGGLDPAYEWRKDQEQPEREDYTVDYLIDKFLEYNEGNCRESTLDQYKRRLYRNISPHIGKLLLLDVTPAHLREIILNISKRGAKIEANRTHTLIQMIFKFAKRYRNKYNRRLVPADYINPAADLDIKRHKEIARQERLDIDQLIRLYQSVDAVIDDPFVAGLIKMSCLYGNRGGELKRLRDKDIDFNGKRFTLYNRKGDTPLEHPLSETAAAILRNLIQIRNIDPKLKSNPYIFCSLKHKDQHIKRIDRRWAKLIQHCGFEGLTPHDIRTSVASIMNEQGIDLAQISDQMGHSSSKITEERYAFLRSEKRRPFIESHAAKLSSLIEDNAKENTA
ncbi:MAG: tyrosine-type recombinase/integrase [Candidatus Omnitrophica bacterium]|nr:tyrosine-type recombinase/integrase [Candidatus Omnitrophota bacterium]